jgi:hypothetical protein
MKPSRLLRLARALGVISLLAPLACAQLVDERAVKAAFVFNLTKYVEWPHPSQELIVGVDDDSPTAETLKKVLEGRNSESRPIHVLLFPSDAQLEQCNILYLGHSSPKKWRAVLDRVRNKSILTVGDSDSFARDGGIIGLVTAADHVQIQVNLVAASEGHLKISSRLLNLSTIVQPTREVRH